MRKILMISFLHSSQKHVGALRTQRFFRHLPEFGWRPYVITKPPPLKDGNPTAQATEEPLYARSIPLNRPFHLEGLLWIPFMFAKALRLMRKEPVDIVLVSCPPFHQALAAPLLKKWFGFKLVIDYRDAWGLNPYHLRLDRFRKFILGMDKTLERRLLRHTDLLIVSHQEMGERYRAQFDFLKDRIGVVYNGFDPEDLEIGHGTLFPDFTILHLGDFYANQKTRDPDLFLSALQRLVFEEKGRGGRLRALFAGEKYAEVERAIATRGLSEYVSYLDRVPRPVAMDYLKRSHMLLLIETTNVMTTKVYEYLATGKPILALGVNPELKALIERYSSNSYVIAHPDVQEIGRCILDCYRNYRRNSPPLLDEFRQTFSRKNQTALLAQRLGDLLEKDKTGAIGAMG